jgi:hypothetical protein
MRPAPGAQMIAPSSPTSRPARPGRPTAGLEYARHGRSLGGESPLEEEVVLTPSRRQLRRREAGWEGSPRRIPAPRNTNRVEGGAIWVSLLKKVKPDTIKGSSRRRGGRRGKVIVLIRGGLPGCRLCCRVAAPTARIARCALTGQKSAEVVVPAGIGWWPGRAERRVRRRIRCCSCWSRGSQPSRARASCGKQTVSSVEHRG